MAVDAICELFNHAIAAGEVDPLILIPLFLLTIFCVFTPSRTTTMPKKLTALEMVRKAICSQIGKITKAQVLVLCPFISASSVEVALKKLVKCGELTKQGAGRSTFYVRTD